MKAVILAAGLGGRMQRQYPSIHKVMLPIVGKPILEHHIENLKKFGVNDFYINLHHYPDIVRTSLGNGKKYGVRIIYSYEKVLLGTAGALRKMKKNLDETFFVVYGDIFTKINFQKFLDFHRNKKSQATLVIHQTNHPEDSDLVMTNEDDKICKFYPSPHPFSVVNTDLSSAGIYILEPQVLKFIPDKIPSDFIEDICPILLTKGVRMYGYLSSEYTKDIGTPERYRQVQREVVD